MLEEVIRVLRHTARHRLHGVQGAGAELGQRFLVDQRSQVLVVQLLDLLDLVRGTETIEEVDERDARLNRREMGHARQIHHLLHGALAQHGEARLAARHHVLMVAKDTQRMGSQRTGRYMEHAREQLARDLVHVRDHQQQTLRSGVGRCQRAGLQRAVNRAGGTGLRLHLLYHDRLAEDVLPASGGPLVYMLRHRRGWGNRVDSRYLAKHIRDMRGGLVTITCNKFLFLCHRPINY